MPNCISGEARQLDGNEKVSYCMAKDEHDLLYLKLTNYSGEGTSSIVGERIYVGELLDCIGSVEGDFRLGDLRDVIPKENNNDLGFVVAVLVHVGFVRPTTAGRYRLGRKAVP